MARFVVALMVGIALFSKTAFGNMPVDPITGVKIGFAIQSITVNEGSSAGIDFVAQNAPQGSHYYCTLKLLNTGSATYLADFTHTLPSTVHEFELTEANQYGFSFVFEALQDNIMDPLEDVDYHGYCYADPDRTIIVETERCNFKALIANQDLTDDPHFFQNVLGMDEEKRVVSENICYDLVGTAGDVYEILTDKVLDLSVLCELRDDYYIGQVKIKTPLGVFLANTDTISVEGRFTRTWNDLSRFERGTDPSLSVELLKDYVLVEMNGKGRRMAVRIDRVLQDKRGKGYLNFYIEETAKNGGVIFDRHHGGLFGIVANNKYEFVKPVQSDEKISTVNVNGRQATAFSQTSPVTNRKCFLMNLEDVISPYVKTDFLKA